MPWNNPISHPFQTTAVILYAPQASGVYALRNAETWVYVGESRDILAQLVQHLNGDNACIKRFRDLTFSYELVPGVERTSRMNELIRELRPVCQPMRG